MCMHTLNSKNKILFCRYAMQVILDFSKRKYLSKVKQNSKILKRVYSNKVIYFNR